MKRNVKIFFLLLLLTLGSHAFNYHSTWVNRNANTVGVTKLVIKNNGMIKAFGQCGLRDCNWGRVRYIRTHNGLLASWKQRNGHKVILIEAVNPNRIKVVVKYLYTHRADRTKVAYFTKKVRRRPVPPYAGNWVNENPRSRSITRINIHKQRNGIFLNAWGRCYPNECNWGKARVRIRSNKIRAYWDQGFVRRSMTVTGQEYRGGRYHRLKVYVKSRYNDGRGTRTEVFYMRRR